MLPRQHANRGELKMSQNYYLKNIDDNEYIRAGGNGNFRDTMRNENPRFFTWVLANKWLGKKVMFVVEHKMPNGYEFITKAKEVTNDFEDEFLKEEGIQDAYELKQAEDMIKRAEKTISKIKKKRKERK